MNAIALRNAFTNHLTTMPRIRGARRPRSTGRMTRVSYLIGPALGKGSCDALAVTFKPEDFATRCWDCPTSAIDSKASGIVSILITRVLSAEALGCKSLL